MTDREGEKLLPCPFCGSTDIRYHATGGGHRFRCRHCLTEGPIGRAFEGAGTWETSRLRTDDAARLWNARASGWQDISTAPKDGTKIALWFREPRGKMFDCFWDEGMGGWFWREPYWLGEEIEQRLHCYPNNQPLYWMRDEPAPAPQGEGE